jgi:ATP-binding cassette subfamily B protein
MGRWLGQKVRVISRQQQDNIAEYGALVEETVSNVRTVMAFNQQGRLLEKFRRQTGDMRRLANKRALVAAAFVAVNVIIGFAALIGVVWLGGLRVMHGQMSLGDMMAFLLYLAFLADAAGNIGNFWPAWQATLGATERVVTLLQQQPRITGPSVPEELPAAKHGRKITFHNVTYAYPSRPETPVLHGLSFTAAAGSNIAVVGPSGAGKSTLFRLLLRLDDPQAGQILLDGYALPTLSLADIRQQFALVAQDSPLFSATVAENVAFAKPDATEGQIRAALAAANAEGFVQALPQGIHTEVGEKGVQLSGGQKQRIAIARALLANAPVLLLDEATSHLDSESEAAIQQALEAASKNRTVITIAHRLSTVKSADVILVLDKGRIAAHGTHNELLKSSPLYKALATLQLQA